MNEQEPMRIYITSDDVLMVSVEDVVDWLRKVGQSVNHCRPCLPAIVCETLADDLRDAWLDSAQGLVR